MSTVLVVDDDRDIVNAICIYLKSDGYDTIKAGNGNEAVEIVKCGKCDLVLLDVMMPVMDGIEAMTEIRKFSNVPVIFLTAKAEDTDKILGLNIGADDYVTKPF
ncbi:MAG: response regulator, partial [Lachnospiraceae bacterium]|nr:response regulator [Lachnospiraceae bacterium]